MTATVGVCVITYEAYHHLSFCLPPLLSSPLKPRVLVLNSSSDDGTVELAEEMGAETLVIPRKEFNHGISREFARKHLGTDIVVMMTPDAYAKDRSMLERLVDPIISKKASVSYARQIPHRNASFLESFSRKFSYPEKSHCRTLNHSSLWGVYTIFCSNACAAYSSEALDEIGGFSDVLTGEDTVAVSQLLRNGKNDCLYSRSSRASFTQLHTQTRV